MAAVTGNVERAGADAGEGVGASGDGLSGLGDVRTGPRDLNSLHAGLMRLHWTRQAVEWFIRQVSFRHEWDGKELVIRVTQSPVKSKGEKHLPDGTPIIPTSMVPWATGGAPVSKVKVWSLSNSKMDCPVFDLPAGPMSVGGTCQGAEVGQTVVPPEVRSKLLRGGALPNNPPGHGAVKLREGETICSHCYATGGSFGYADNQARMVLRFWWARAMVESHFEELVRVLVESIAPLKFPPGAPGGIWPIRLHSSGDFFSQRYAEAWLEVAKRIAAEYPLVRFWAPTRTWASGKWQEFWATRLPKVRNFMVRASAYHFGDAAPEALGMNNARGSTSLFVQDKEVALARQDFRADAGERAYFDWQCPAYSVGHDAHSCSNSANELGGVHCRACWTRPELRVNYPAH